MMERLTKTYSDGTHAAADNLPCGENSYEYKGLLLEALGKYEDSDEQGLLLRLPVKVGDTVWRIKTSDNYIMPCNVEEFVYSNSLYIVVREEFFNTRKGWSINEIGKTIFLTQAEAEQKLKEMGNK